MIAWFTEQSPIIQALLGTLFTWGMTAAGAALVFLFREIRQNVLTGMLGFASGVMIAASYWSLLAPAIEMAAEYPIPDWLPATIGFLLGGVFLWGLDKTLPHLHQGRTLDEAEGIPTTWRRIVLLVSAITLHNIPEGLAIGVAFGAAAAGLPSATVAGAAALAIGIGIQNFPEGTAVSVPLRLEGMSRGRAFFYGQLSGAVEPISAIVGVIAVTLMRPLLPYALAFAAGAMIYVVAEELIPEAKTDRHSDVGTIGVMIGFAVMMTLDVALG